MKIKRGQDAGTIVASGKVVDLTSSCIRSVQYVAQSGKLFIRFASNPDRAYEHAGVAQVTVTRMVKWLVVQVTLMNQ